MKTAIAGPSRGWLMATIALAGCLVLLAATTARATTFSDSGFGETDVVFNATTGEELRAATAIDWAPDGRMFIAEKRGVVRVAAPNGTLLPNPLIDIRDQVNNKSDRGLLGLAVDADFETNRRLYLLYTYETNPANPDQDGPMTARLTRVTVNANSTVANPSNPETSILGSDYEDPCPAPDNTRDCIPSDYIWHTIGTVRSDPTDGTLWVGVGDGHGIDEAWVGDPYGPGESPYIFRPYDEHSYSGKILHVDRDGQGLPGHPFCPSDTNLSHTCTKIYAEGFRNPFRFTLRPAGLGQTTPGLVAGDVGQSRWEEVDLVQPGRSYGWPCWEANVHRDPYEELPTCQAEYAKEGTPQAPIRPAWDYPHATGSNAVIAGPVYQGPNYPSSFVDKVFVGDYAQGWIKVLTVAGNQVTDIDDFATDWPPGVDLELMPNGDLAYVDIGFAQTPPEPAVRRITYAEGNEPPVPVAEANRTQGEEPLTVDFTGSNSTDPEDDDLTYDWDFGDGSAHSSEADPTHTYDDPGLYTARLTVDDGFGRNPSDTVEIEVGEDEEPIVNIVSPEAGEQYEDGSVVSLEGTASDAEDDDEELTEDLRWEIQLDHAGHIHPLDAATGGESSFMARNDHDADSHYKIILTVEDSFGHTAVDSVEIQPRTIPLTLSSRPTAAPLRYSEDSLRNAPFNRQAAVGFAATIDAEPEFSHSGHTYVFDRWSDGGGRRHGITVPGQATQFTATYERETPPDTLIDSSPQGSTEDFTPSFHFHSPDADSEFECKVEPDPISSAPFAGCASPHVAGPLPDGDYTFTVRAVDPHVGTPDPEPATREFSVDAADPLTPTIDGSDPDSPANHNSPLFVGFAEVGTTVALYANRDCSGTPAATGSAMGFAWPGIAVEFADDTESFVSARATDAAGNASPCSAAVKYAEDSSEPEPSAGAARLRAGAPIEIEVKADEDAKATATGKVVIGSGPEGGQGSRALSPEGLRSRKVPLAKVRTELAAGRRTVLKLRPEGGPKRSRRALKRIERLVEDEGKATAKLKVTVTDQAGNRARMQPKFKLRADRTR